MGWQKAFGLFMVFLVPSTALLADIPKTVDVELQHSFVPIGFDDNDRLQVMVTGVFPDSCYKVGEYEVRKNEAASTIFIHQKALAYGGQCQEILVPFTQVIDLGLLKSGTYTIKDELSGKTLGTLPIAKSKVAEADDNLYAPVSDAYIHTDAGKSTIYLRGNFTDRCTKLKEVIVDYYQDVIVVRPIAEHLEAGTHCGKEKIRFMYEAALKDGLSGAQLLHVRAMDGQAVNRMVEFP